MPLENVFWIAGAAAAIVTLATPAFLLLDRVSKIERRIAKLEESTEWIKHFVYQNRE